MTARDLVTLYLAWAIGHVSQRLPYLDTGMRAPTMTCSLGIPVDHTSVASPLKSAFEEIARDAWRLRNHVQQGVPVNTGVGWLRALQKNGRDNAADSSLMIVCPETLAAVVSHATSPTARLGMYALVDIGAWTTDISVFRLTDVSKCADAVNTTAVYNARTVRVAADRIDQLTADLLQQLWFECGWEAGDQTQSLVLHVRGCREQGRSLVQEYQLGGQPRPLVDTALEHARAVVAESVTRHVLLELGHAFRKESMLSKADWEHLEVLLLGGGSEERIFGARLSAAKALKSVKRLQAAGSLPWGTGGKGNAALVRRLQVAAGLSVPYALWPKVLPPGTVTRPDEGVAPRPAWEGSPFAEVG